MSVRIQLDNPPAFYTNLDCISGRIILSLTREETIQAIVAKLEGESRTQLIRPMGPEAVLHGRRDNRHAIAGENHKILYKVSQVFPSVNPPQQTPQGLSYTLRPGQHEYPFRFKIPLNNGCMDPSAQGMGPGSGFGGLGLGGLAQLQYRHVKRTLPPSLTGFPGEAEIRYYVKVTVQRPSLFKENRRSAIGFKFLPIEPPRPPPSTNEAYARRPFTFQSGLPEKTQSSMFMKRSTPVARIAPSGEVDARLPTPPILTCNEPIPLRLILRKLNDSPENVFLTSLQIQLFGTTEVRAQDVVRRENSNWVLLSANSLTIPIGKPSDAPSTEIILDKSLWDKVPLPNTIAPSFQTCNLTRSYQLEVKLVLGYQYPGATQFQKITLPLNFQVEIYSGITPPPALLAAVASQPTPPTPAHIPPISDPLYPPQLGTPAAATADEAPPSYEDAMAEDITQADGPRREYSGVTDVNAPNMDEKQDAPGYSTIFGRGRGG